jgi:CBS domain-containing protein
MRKHIVIAPLQSTVFDLLPLFFEKRLNSLPILNGKHQLVGIVVREDVLKLLYPDYQVYIQDMIANDELDAFDKDFSEVLLVKTQDIMQTKVLTVTPKTPVMQALARMIAHHIDQMPVVTDKGKLVSIVTKADIFYALYKTNKKRIHP